MELKRKMNSITSRWFFSVFSVILFFLIVLEIILITYINSNSEAPATSYLDRKTDVGIKSFSSIIVESGYDIYAAAETLFNDITQGENTVKTEIFDTETRLVRSSEGSFGGTLESVPESQTTKTYVDSDTGIRLMAKTVPLRDSAGKIYGALRFTVSLEKIHSRQMFYIITSVVAGVLIALFVFVSGFYFMQSIVSPVNKVTKTASRIAKGDFSIRLDKKHDDEIGDLSDAINNMAAELSNIDRLKNDFISSVSHELRTPLTAIRGWNETIASCDPETDADTIAKGLQIIDTETDRLSKMVEELLDYTKMQSGRFTISKSRVDLFALFLETFDIYAPKAAAAGVDIVYDTPIFSTYVRGDANRLKQVFINIIDNAVKHSDPDSTINVSFACAGGMYTVFFTDHGHGIKAEDLPKIKEKFYKGSSTKPGSGLGLAVCDEIIQLHGGSLNIESEEGKGTTVAVTLPSDTEPEHENEQEKGNSANGQG